MRLREHFPQAKVSLLAPPASKILAQYLPEIDEVIEFEFFFAKSELGPRQLSVDELTGLWKQLEPRHFDLAVDLRKMPDTRPVLRFTGARWLAGYDQDNQNPWLDISLEWDGDAKFFPKRSHIGDDLMRLVDAIALASRPERAVLPRDAMPVPVLPGRNKDDRKPLVCVHPGVGTATRRWPSEYFAALIDMLVAHHDVEVAVIGSPDEAEIADQVMRRVHRRTGVRSLIGKLKLAELPGLLASASLFIGNNSGPKHIAAGLGVPTVGIHSGVVDAREWGPMGPNAVAVRRDMHCSPCYLAHPEDCHRGLACLRQLRPAEVYEVCRRYLAVEPAPR